MIARLPSWMRTPAFATLVLAPAGTELLTGNMPPFVFFFPPVLAIVVILYGGGAIIAHELMVRWGKGWPSLLALAIAYGVYEEGLLMRTFFDPNAADINASGDFARFFGVNWVEVLRLTMFHSVFAILIPLLLVGFLFPDKRRESWVSPRILRILVALILLELPIGWLMRSYRPSAVAYLICFGVVIALIGFARILPTPTPSAEAGNGWDRRLVIQGYIANALLFVFGWILPAASVPWPISVTLLIGLALVVAVRVVRGRYAIEGLLALAAGGLGFYASSGPILELFGRRGAIVVGIVALILLVRLSRRVRRSVPLTPEAAGICLAA